MARAGTVLEQNEPPLTDQAPETQVKQGTTNRLSSVDDLRGHAERAYVTMRCSIAVAPEPPGPSPARKAASCNASSTAVSEAAMFSACFLPPNGLRSVDPFDVVPRPSLEHPLDQLIRHRGRRS